MSLATETANMFRCDQEGKLLGFKDASGRVTHVYRDELDDETMTIVGNPEVLTIFRESLDDFLDGRIVDFDF
ncbi:hypothetical protein [Corynebacterium xerosis]|uniref:hypothetical protein n=1 Tax=Corynebacterium xerosis TaxID=1725 RepID=UPI00366F5FCF